MLPNPDKAIWTRVMAVLLLLGFTVLPIACASIASMAGAQDTGAGATDPWRSSDWLIFVNARVLNHFLNYKSSSLSPITEVQVTYKLRDVKTGKWNNSRAYANLWFSNGKAIGCRKYESLAVSPQTEGIIIIEQTKDVSEQTKALSGTIVRMFLDVQLKQALLEYVIAPKDIDWKLSSDLGHFSFYPATSIRSNQFGVLLHMVSANPLSDTDAQDSPPFDKYFFFRTK